MTPRQLLTSTRQDYLTPKAGLFDKLQAAFNIELDPCTSHDNPLGTKYFITENQDALQHKWMFDFFMNPPYKNLEPWVRYAYRQTVENHVTGVCLITAKTETRIWHEIIWPKARALCFVKKRLKFGPVNKPATFPSVVAVFGPNEITPEQMKCLEGIGRVVVHSTGV